MAGTPPTPAEMETAFSRFAARASGTEATSKDVTRWFTDSGVLSKKPHMTCNSHTLDVCFTTVKGKGGNTMSFMDIDKLIIQVAKTYKADNNVATDEEAIAQIKVKLAAAKPIAHNTTTFSAVGGTDRLAERRTSERRGSDRHGSIVKGTGTSAGVGKH